MQIVSPNFTYACDFHDWPVSRSHCTLYIMPKRFANLDYNHSRGHVPEVEFVTQGEGRRE
jgi:hypothetical protein